MATVYFDSRKKFSYTVLGVSGNYLDVPQEFMLGYEHYASLLEEYSEYSEKH
jgi:hypothetical protein